MLGFKLGTKNHNLIVNSVSNNSITLTIQSNPIRLTLLSGEEKKLNISSKDYYDLYVKVDKIEDKKATITIKKINESMFVIEPVDYEYDEPIDISKVNSPDEQMKTLNYRNLFIFIGLVVLIIIVVVFWFKSRSKIHNISNI